MGLSYAALETMLIVLAIVVSAAYATAHLAPALVARWRRNALLWLIAERRAPWLRELGRRWARSRQPVAADGCGACASKPCAPKP